MELVFKQVERLTMVVQDAEKVAEEYAAVYGMGPWKVDTYEAIKIAGESCKAKCALCKMDSYEFEVIQPLEQEGFLARRLQEKGNDALFLSLSVDNPQQLVDKAKAAGRACVALYGDDDSKGYTLLDYTPELGFYLAVHGQGACYHGGKTGETRVVSPDGSQVKVNSFCQLGIVVKDFYATMDLLYGEFGLGPWQCIRFDQNTLSDVVHLGVPIEYGLDVSHAMVGDVEFELLSPLDDHSTFGKYLKEHGNGMHHVSLSLGSPYDDVLDCFKQHGRGPAQTAIVAGFEFCAFCDHTQSIGLFLEMGKVIAEPSGPPPEMPLYPA